MNRPTVVAQNPWECLREVTAARIALGRCGASLPTQQSLAFQLDHARAKDAVLERLDAARLAAEAQELTGQVAVPLSSAVADRREYLMRPDLGRRLADDSRQTLGQRASAGGYALSITVADGLSACAVHEHFAPFLREFLPLVADLVLAPVAVVTNGRVAVADEIAHGLGATVAVMLIGERPGLKSPNSMGIYMTYRPTPGTTDERRNCISNVRPEGLSYGLAASKLHYLLRESLVRKLSGVELKDEQVLPTTDSGMMLG